MYMGASMSGLGQHVDELGTAEVSTTLKVRQLQDKEPKGTCANSQ